jgi:hypothetical protein
MISPFKVEEFKPQLRATVTRKLIRHGPFTLPAKIQVHPNPLGEEKLVIIMGDPNPWDLPPKLLIPLTPSLARNAWILMDSRKCES